MKDPFESECYYHVYNHSVGSDNIFSEDKNYLYFLQRFSDFLDPISETLCYCLMPNHFHFLIKIKIIPFSESLSKSKLLKILKNTEDSLLQFEIINKYVSKQFSNFFSAYAQAYNIFANRKGGLFSQNFKHKKIISDDYFTKVIHYIHYNPVHHGFTATIDEWPYSSYNIILSDKPTNLNRNAVLSWFGGKDNFIQFHRLKPESINYNQR